MEDDEPFMALIIAMGDEMAKTAAIPDLEEPFRKRLLVRVFFSVLEGYAFHVKQRALSIGTHRKHEFSKRQMEMLTETRDGQTRYPPSRKNLAFAVSVYAQVTGAKLGPDLPEQDSLTSFSVRDRLTHPKRAADLRITGAESAALASLLKWFMAAVKWIGEAEQAHIAQLREETSASFQSQIDAIRRSKP